MGVVDIFIIIIMILGILLGIKRGFTKQLICSISTVASVVLAFIFKNKISIILYSNLPFYKFGGVLKGATVLNILLYELIAFLILFAIFKAIFNLLSLLTGILEGILMSALVIGIPSRILGAILGFIESYMFVFFLLFMLTLPIIPFNDYITKHSEFADNILSSTPVVSSYTKDTIEIVNEFSQLKEKYKKADNSMQFNRDTLNLFLKYKIVTVESVDLLVKKDKLKIDAIEEVLRCYREETKNQC